MSEPSRDDHRIAHDLATQAGEILLRLRAELSEAGVDGKELNEAVDQAAHIYLCEQLAALRPDDALLSEEGIEDEGPEGAAPVEKEVLTSKISS
jgi:3'(2'), 5'-bisphosphate nucleotidase